MPESPRIDVIDFFGKTTFETMHELIKNVNNAIAEKSSKIIIRINSIGGDLAPAFGAYHYLRYSNVAITAYNIGNVESAAMLLYLSADIRIAAPTSRFLIHPLSLTSPNGLTTIKTITEAAKSLEFDIGRYAEIFKHRTKNENQTLDILKCLESDSFIVGASEALSLGITTETRGLWLKA